jgi:hypothetical protein
MFMYFNKFISNVKRFNKDDAGLCVSVFFFAYIILFLCLFLFVFINICFILNFVAFIILQILSEITENIASGEIFRL